MTDFALNVPSAESVGREIGEMLRAHHSGYQDFTDDELFFKVIELAASKCRTAKDALALVVMAQRLMNSRQPPENEADATAHGAAMALLANAIGGLQKLSKERASIFLGHEWH